MLKRNATVAVVAPAGIPQLAGVAAGVKLVKSWGYEVILAPNVEKQHHFTAGTAEERTQDLLWALTAEGIDAVWLARGGYGCMHCLPSLPREGLDRRPVIGCSDATALFAALVTSRGGHLVHGPMLETIATKVDDATRERIRAMLAGDAVAPIAAQHFAGPKEEVRGRVVGGNLCVLASLAGTPWALDARGAIVVLEEVTEVPYRVDRLIMQLRLSGALDGAVGIALGDFVKCEPPEGARYELTDVLREALEPLGLPVWSRLTLGHDKRNLAFCVGEEGTLGPGGLSQARSA
ncbi:S66 peptidase family protein [Polyangium mundeleinium]|uniref:LD-carboxypeptidase n=1 Tax=Polyangium mundeleinium TaxID=2995306 RepID=A0ABT5EDC9_9BACT|nr:LD-carboxypeptidase [Polyangium mundeleinium]MDC0739828.1 LD-carboxypeptidase [Polyangium mundeleinium]